MAQGYMSPISTILQIFSDQGVVGNGYKIFTYVGGSVSTPLVTYTDSALSVQNSNPIIMGSNGRYQNVSVWVPGGTLLKMVLTDATGAAIVGGTIDNIPAINDLSTVAYFGFSPGEIANSVVPVNFGWPAGYIYRYGTNTIPGTTDMTTAFTNAVKATNVVRVPADTYKITSVPVAKDNVTIQGDGWNSILIVGTTNSTLFTVTGQNFTLNDCQWQGDGTSNSSVNGVGVYLNGAGNALFQDNFSTGFGFGAISGVAASALGGPRIIRQKCRLTAAGGTDFYLGGIWSGTLIEDPDCYSPTADRALLLFDNGTTGWTGLIVRGGGANGYLKQQWAVTDENWDGSNRVWTALFDGLNNKASNWSAIKCKTSQNVKIVNCTFDACGVAQEDAGNGLYGDVLVNSLGTVEVSGCTFRNSGSASIRCIAPQVSQYPGANPGGQATSMWSVTNNLINTTGVNFAQGDGVALINGMKEVRVEGNIMRGILRYGVNALSVTTSPFWDVHIYNNTVTDSPAMTEAFNVGFAQSLQMDGNFVQNGGGTGTIITDVDEVYIGRMDTVLDPAVGSGRGYQIGNVKDLDFYARAGNSTYATWVALTPYTVGNRVFNGANVYECVVGGTSGNTGGPVVTSGATTEGTVTWYFVGKYQLLPYAIRLVGTQGRCNLDFDPAGCITGPIEVLTTGIQGTFIHYTTNLQTTNATPTNTQVIPITDTTGFTCEMKASAQYAGGPDHASYYIVGLFYRAGAGTARQGGLSSVWVIESDATWDAAPVISGNNLIPAQVTGAAGKTVNWAIDITLRGSA